VLAVQKVDQRLQQSFDVLSAVVAELHQEVKQPQHLPDQTENDECTIDVKKTFKNIFKNVKKRKKRDRNLKKKRLQTLNKKR